ncbi:MAG: VOC family protein [Gammaproteobacteria bacterium]|jgi:catechol 2,3-dioxygenase-like lactoylglutathione lyase family enzyme
MGLNRMEHFLVLTDDIDATRDFYCQALGMETGFRPPLGFPGYWVYLGDTPCIHIAEWETYTAHSHSLGIPVSERTAGTGPVDHIAFTGTDYDAMLARLKDMKIEVNQNIVPGGGLQQLFLEDPNGVKIELNFWPDTA